ncbi:MAG: M48 family metalloprotease [Pseudonocardiaceae bacterium]
MSQLLLSVPEFLCSLVVIWFLAQLLGGVAGVVLILCWLASGLVFVLFRPAEEALARVYFRFRRPTLAQQQQLEHLWGEVTSTAGVDGSKYTLWVQDRKELNAFAASGHIVGVTRWSLEKTPPRQLAAVLAHELGHHMGGHSWALLLSSWYAVPGRIVLRITWAVLKFVVRFALAVAKHISIIGYLCVWFMVIGLIFFAFAAAPFLLVVYLIPPTLAWFERQGEKRADRFAAELGYGPLLIEALNSFQTQEGYQDTRTPLLARLMASHPPLHDRIRRLEEFEQGLRAP